jgi:hypothetical protein
MGAKAQVHIGKDIYRIGNRSYTITGIGNNPTQSYQGGPCLLRPSNQIVDMRTRQQACAAVPPRPPKIAHANPPPPPPAVKSLATAHVQTGPEFVEDRMGGPW